MNMILNRVPRHVLAACIAVLFALGVVGGYFTTFAQQSNTKFLPLLVNGGPVVTQFGVQADAPIGTDSAYLRPLNVEWLRLTGPLWSEVEPTQEGGYNWNATSVRFMDRAVATMQRENISPRVILISVSSPTWATIDGGTCGALKPEHYGDYARFMTALVQRYNTINYFEIGNEPDIDVDVVNNPFSGFGCWGDESDEFYGGRAYGEMLKTVYPAIKQARPSVQVLNGGLLLDRPFNQETGEGRPGRFMEGVFEAGAGGSFDIMNYHFYTYYQSGSPTPDGVSTIGNGADDWKARYLREMMQRYGVAEKPLINTETALLCSVNPEQLAECRNAQANAVGRLYARAANNRLLAATWYTFATDSFNNTSFFDRRSGTLHPVYNAFKHARAMLGGSIFQGALANQAEGIEGYQFKNGSLDVTIFWSDQNDKIANVSVPADSTPRCTRRDGSVIGCQNNGGAVSLPAVSEPTYVIVP